MNNKPVYSNKPTVKSSDRAQDLAPFIVLSIVVILTVIVSVILKGETTCFPIPCGNYSIAHTISEELAWAIPVLIMIWIIFAISKFMKKKRENGSIKIPVCISLSVILLLTLVALFEGPYPKEIGWFIGGSGPKSMLYTIRNNCFWAVPIIFMTWLFFAIFSKSISKKLAPLWYTIAFILVSISILLTLAIIFFIENK